MIAKRLVLACAVAVCCATPCLATDFLFLSGKDADAKLPPAKDGLSIHTPYLRDASREEIVMRTASGVPEVHRHWNDLTVILDGTATLVYGGTLTGAKETAPGELRGGHISGSKIASLAKDAIYIIPVGMPHQVVLAPGAHLKYIVFGTRE